MKAIAEHPYECRCSYRGSSPVWFIRVAVSYSRPQAACMRFARTIGSGHGVLLS